jgi:hypothetical protein
VDEWVPFGLTDDETEIFLTLRPGLNQPARQSLIAWIMPAFGTQGNLVHSELVRALQLATDIFLGVTGPGSISSRQNFVEHLDRLEPNELFRVADWVLATTGSGLVERRGKALDEVLRTARSRWTVGVRMGRPGLLERVPEGVQEFAQSVMEAHRTAGTVLAKAWLHLHGLEPRPGNAYSEAVVATEIAAVAAVQPSNAQATLGTVISQMERDGDWRLPLREHGKAPSHDLIIAILRTLWYGHRDRHGNSDYSEVSYDEARAAVSLAVVAVDWFSAGLLVRVPLDSD